MPAIQMTAIKNAIATWLLTASGLTPDRLRWAGGNNPEPPTSSTLPWLLIGRFTWSNPGSDWTSYEDKPFAFSPKTVVLSAAGDTGAAASHNLLTRDGPVRLQTTGSLAGTNLAVATDYWVTRVDANTIKFSTTFLNAHNGVYIDIAGAGTGTHTLVSTADTRRAGQELREIARGARRLQFDVQCFPAIPALGEPVDDASDPVSILSDIVAKIGLSSIADPLAAAGIGILDPGQPRAVDGILNSVFFEPRAVMTVVLATTSEVEGTATIIDTAALDNDGPNGSDFNVDLTRSPNDP